jgi:hypothetical protein
MFQRSMLPPSSGCHNPEDFDLRHKICLLIDVAIPSDRNVMQKQTETKLKYKNLSIKTQRMWNKKYFVIPVITGAT